MMWKELPYWAKGGIIGFLVSAIFYILNFFFSEIWIVVFLFPLWALGESELFSSSFMDKLSTNDYWLFPTPSFLGFVIATLFNIILGIIIGALIGLIISKIKSRRQLR